METPTELLEEILIRLWNSSLSYEERKAFLISAVLVNTQWRDTFARCVSTTLHIVSPQHSNYMLNIISRRENSFIYHYELLNSLCSSLYFTISNPLAFHEELLRMGCPHFRISAHIHEFLELLCNHLAMLPNLCHVEINNIDDSLVHVPTFQLPEQVKELHLNYYFRPLIRPSFQQERDTTSLRCRCHKQQHHSVTRLSVFGINEQFIENILPYFSELCSLTTNSMLDSNLLSPHVSVAVKDQPASVCSLNGHFPYQLLCGRLSPLVKYWMPHVWSCGTWDRSIPIGTVGYFNSSTRQFTKLFNAGDPQSAEDTRIHRLPPLAFKEDELKCDSHISRRTDWLPTLPQKMRKWVFGPNEDYSCKETFTLTSGSSLCRVFTGAYSQFYMAEPGLLGCGRLEMDIAAEWFQTNLNKIYNVYADGHGVQLVDLLLVYQALQTNQYAFFIDGGQHDAQVIFHRSRFPSKGSPWGEFHTTSSNADLASARWSYVSGPTSPPKTLFLWTLSIGVHGHVDYT